MEKTNTTLKKFRSKNKSKLSSQARKSVLVRKEHLQKEEQIKVLEEVIRDSEESVPMVQNPKQIEILRILALRNYLQKFSSQKYFLSSQKNKTIRGQYVNKWQQIYDFEAAVNHFNDTNFVFESEKKEAIHFFDLHHYLQKFNALKYFPSDLRKELVRAQNVVKRAQIQFFQKAVSYCHAPKYIVIKTDKKETRSFIGLQKQLQAFELSAFAHQKNNLVYKHHKHITTQINQCKKAFTEKPKINIPVAPDDYLNNSKLPAIQNRLAKIANKKRKERVPKIDALLNTDWNNQGLNASFQNNFTQISNYKKIQTQFVNAVLKKDRRVDIFEPANWQEAEKVMAANLDIQKKFQTRQQTAKKIKEEKISPKKRKLSRNHLQKEKANNFVTKQTQLIGTFKKNVTKPKQEHKFIKEIKTKAIDKNKLLLSKIDSIQIKMNRPIQKDITKVEIPTVFAHLEDSMSYSSRETMARIKKLQKRMAKLSTPKKKKFRHKKKRNLGV